MLELPDPVAAYVAAGSDADEAALATIDTVVRDEAREHQGLPSICAWRVDTMARSPFTLKPVSVAKRDGTIIVATEVTGSFPGSPLVLDHRFTLRDGRMAALEIV